MASHSLNLLELDVSKLLESRKIDEVTEIQKLLDDEIEKKRLELRLMVGNRYKDVLAASDAIKNMKVISKDIVRDIDEIGNICGNLIAKVSDRPRPLEACDMKSNAKRIIIVQVRLAIFMNEQIWTALDGDDNLTASQLYLLAQHIHTGLALSQEQYLFKLPILRQVQVNLLSLRGQILSSIDEKLRLLEISAEESSSNLTALLILKNYTATQLFHTFLEQREIALKSIVSKTHSSVRVQVSEMVKCLITTIQLLHDCFKCYNNAKVGLIKQLLENIVEDTSLPTISKIKLPSTLFLSYIPADVKEFRPNYKNSTLEHDLRQVVDMEKWLMMTTQLIKEGMCAPLKLISNVTGLHLIREDALKIGIPANWQAICLECSLSADFDVWFNFFQSLLTERVKQLMSDKLTSIMDEVYNDVQLTLESCNLKDEELQWHLWNDNLMNVNEYLTMRNLGHPPEILILCEKFDDKYLQLLADISQYMYGREYDEFISKISGPLLTTKCRKKLIDLKELESHLRIESAKNCTRLTMLLEDFIRSEGNTSLLIPKSLMCARFLQATVHLCPHFTQCCTFGTTSDEWNKISDHFMESSIQFWEKWIEHCVQNTHKELGKYFDRINCCSMIQWFLRWDTIEIQEQTEERIFKSQIRVPLKPSLILHNILTKLNADLTCVLAHTLPKAIHATFVTRINNKILACYDNIFNEELNQNQALQFLFDIKFLATLCIPKNNIQLLSASQEICDKLRTRIDPFDLDVFYPHIQNNVKKAVSQSQVVYGCLLPSSMQLDNLGISEKSTEQEKEPSILALSVPSLAFPLFSTFAHQRPLQKALHAADKGV